MKRFKSRSFLVLSVLAIVLALAGIAWANYDRFDTTDVDNIVLRNSAGEDLRTKANAIYNVNLSAINTADSANGSRFKVTLNYADGYAWESSPVTDEVKKIDFDLTYQLMNGDKQGSLENAEDAKITFGFGKLGASFVVPGERDLSVDKLLDATSSFTANFTMNEPASNTVESANDPHVNVRRTSGTKSLNTDIAVNRYLATTTVLNGAYGGTVDTGSGSTIIGEASYGKLFLNSYYGLRNPKNNPLIPGVLRVNLRAVKNGAVGVAYWHIKPVANYLTITEATSASANGLSGSVYDGLKENDAQEYHVINGNYSLSDTLNLQFTGKPISTARIPEFHVKGTLADQVVGTAPTDRLQDVSTFVRLPQVLDSKIDLNAYEFIFDKDVETAYHLTVAYKNGEPTTYGIFMNINDANLFDAGGNPIFDAGVVTVPWWNGMTITRSLTQPITTGGYRGIQFAFSGAPTSYNHASDLFVGARTRATPTSGVTPVEISGPFLFGPVTMTVKGVTPVTPELRATPASVSMLAGTTDTKTAAITNATTGNAVNITGISTSSTTHSGSLSLTWNDLTIARSTSDTSVITVSGKPTAAGSHTVYVYDGTTAKPAPLTIYVTSPSAATITPTPAAITGIVSKDLTTKSVGISSTSGTPTVTGVSPTKWNGLTLSYSGSSVTISGVPDATGKETFNVNALVNGVQANPTSFTIDIAAQPALILSPNSLSGVAGTSLGEKLISVGALTGSGAVEVTGLTQSSSTTGKSIKWNDLTISASGSTITVTGTPGAADSTDITVSGTVGGTTATSATLRISVAAAGTPQLQLDSSAASATVGSAMATKTFTVTGSLAGAIVVNGVTGGTQTTVSKEFTWKGLTIKTDGNKVTVSGTPTETGSATFTVSGTVGGVTAQTAAFTVTITQAASPTLFQSSSSWKANRTDYSYELWIPVTSAFVNAFDANKDGKVTKNELQKVLADMNHPYASLISTVFDMINDDGSAYGTLYLKSNFNPANGHTADWYINMILKGLDIIGANGTTYGNDFSNIVLEAIQRYYDSGGSSSGCDAGFGALALLALGAAVVLRKKD